MNSQETIQSQVLQKHDVNHLQASDWAFFQTKYNNLNVNFTLNEKDHDVNFDCMNVDFPP